METVEVRFALRPLDAVTPWGDPETGQQLGWFGLTEGTYELRIGRHRLFCPEGHPHGVDYFVSRPWEDLMSFLLPALEPIPAELRERLADYPAWCAWLEHLSDRDDVPGIETLRPIAIDWWDKRILSTSHLRDATRLSAWRDGKQVQLRWSTPASGEKGARWTSESGASSCTVDGFRGAILAFDRQLIAAMEARVVEVERGWRRPGVELDARQLRIEHADRGEWMQRRLQQLHVREYEWDEVIAAVCTLERYVPR